MIEIAYLGTNHSRFYDLDSSRLGASVIPTKDAGGGPLAVAFVKRVRIYVYWKRAGEQYQTEYRFREVDLGVC